MEENGEGPMHPPKTPPPGPGLHAEGRPPILAENHPLQSEGSSPRFSHFPLALSTPKVLI